MFQTVDWTVPQLGGLLSQVCAWLLATARSCAIPSVPWPAAASIASSEPTAAISICVSSPDKPTASTSAIITTATSPPRPSPPPPAPASLCANRTAAPQVIVKEERQLNEPKPRITLKHPWNPEDLAGRPNTWKPVRQKPREDTDKMCVRQTFPPRYSRSTMLHERRSDEVLRLGLGLGLGLELGRSP